jgi:nitrogen fixation protein FixH
MVAKADSPWRSPWFLGWMALLIVFLMGDSVMIYLATSSEGPGLVVKDYYDRGQDFEQNMMKRKAMDPGWEMKVVVPESIAMTKEVIVNFKVRDKDAKPVNRDSVVFHVYRPSDARQDFEVPMQRIDNGLYEAHVTFPLPGVWDVLVTVPNGEIEVNFPKRIDVAKR